VEVLLRKRDANYLPLLLEEGWGEVKKSDKFSGCLWSQFTGFLLPSKTSIFSKPYSDV
jgi:hypothetical protein